VSAAVNVICELASKNPQNYLSLAPQLFKLLTTSNNNWMVIKIIKLVRRPPSGRDCVRRLRLLTWRQPNGGLSDPVACGSLAC